MISQVRNIPCVFLIWLYSHDYAPEMYVTLHLSLLNIPLIMLNLINMDVNEWYRKYITYNKLVHSSKVDEFVLTQIDHNGTLFYINMLSWKGTYYTFQWHVEFLSKICGNDTCLCHSRCAMTLLMAKFIYWHEKDLSINCKNVAPMIIGVSTSCHDDL